MSTGSASPSRVKPSSARAFGASSSPTAAAVSTTENASSQLAPVPAPVSGQPMAITRGAVGPRRTWPAAVVMPEGSAAYWLFGDTSVRGSPSRNSR
ncbi:MAG: hypothetical protein IPG47_12215 [Thermoflexaceae bacterium]|nr:hypothetical protein [Thermoflexaceae bacterium]